MIPIPYIPLLSVSTWLGLFRRRRKAASGKRRARSDWRRACIAAVLLACGCTVEPPVPISPPALPFPHTEVTARQRAYQEAKKADPNMPRRTGLVLR